jgi:hypothetical protein
MRRFVPVRAWPKMATTPYFHETIPIGPATNMRRARFRANRDIASECTVRIGLAFFWLLLMMAPRIAEKQPSNIVVSDKVAPLLQLHAGVATPTLPR